MQYEWYAITPKTLADRTMDRLSSILNSYKPQCASVLLHHVEKSPLQVSTAAPATARLCLIQKGPIEWISDEAKLTLNAGDLLWISEEGAGQWISTGRPAEIVLCEITFGTLQGNLVLERMPAHVLIPEKQHDASLSMAPVIDLMLQEATTRECGQSQVLQKLAEVLIIRAMRFLMRHAVINEGIMGALGDIRLARAITAIHDAPEVRWTVEDLAQQAGMSRTAFSNSFSAVVGKPPMHYLTDWRMRLASLWLNEKEMSVGQIADQLGYRSETAFRRAFRNTMGITPGAVRGHK